MSTLKELGLPKAKPTESRFFFRDLIGRLLPTEQLTSSLLLCVMSLIGIGLVQVYSSSYIFATEAYGDGLYFFKRQLAFATLSICVMFVCIQLPLAWLKKWAWLFWLGSFLAVSMTLIPHIGVQAGGAFRWLKISSQIRFEPGEFLKIALSFYFASWLCRQENYLKKIHWSGLLFFLFLPFGILLKQPDFGTFALLTFVLIGLLFAFGISWKYILGFVALAVPLFYFLVMTVDYRRARVFAFLDPWSDPDQKGFQIIQSLLSFHSGGLMGVGLGRGQGKLFFLPEAHTDFTLAVLGEELGFVGIFLILALYGFIIFKGFQISLKLKDTFSKALAMGLTLTFTFSVFINAGVSMGLLPTKGLTMPFLSYGGSSLLSLAILFGILINLETQSQRAK